MIDSPPSPASTAKTSPSPIPHSANLDDVFGSAPPSPTTTAATPLPETLHSDLPTLKRQHMTTGYREGLSLSKAQHMQRGFDAGYPIGAGWGVRAGRVLGVLEGVVKAMGGKGKEVEGKLREARRELAVGGLLEGVEEGELAEGKGRRVGERAEEVLRKWEGFVGGFMPVVAVEEEEEVGS